MNINYLTLEELLRIHFQLIEDFGGSHGIRDEGRLKSVIAAPKQSVFSKDQYPELLQKAAVYMRNIIGDHPFIDGNKRIALTICAIFLMGNGYCLVVDPSILEVFTVRVATEHLTIDDIAVWLAARIKSTNE